MSRPDPARLLRDPRVASAWFAVEAFGVVGFWAALFVLPQFRSMFIGSGPEEQLLFGFAAADTSLVLASALSAVGARRRAQWSATAMLLVAALWAYPTIYALSVAVSGHGAELAAALMLPVAVINIAFAVAARSPRDRVPGRVSSHASVRWNVLKTCGELAILWAVFLWAIPALIDRLESAAGWQQSVPETSRTLGFALLGAGTLVLGWSAVVMAWKGGGTPFPFDAPRSLVVEGPYRYVRNPQVMGGLLQALSLVLLEWSPLLVLYVVAGTCVWQLVLRPWEEADLVDRFGQPYEAYRASVRCWLPTRRPYSNGPTFSEGPTQP